MLDKYNGVDHASLNNNTVNQCHKMDADHFLANIII